MIFKTEAVVLRKNKISDGDVILTLFTRKCGKIKAVAKGGTKLKTKLSSASHPFIYGEFIIRKGRNLDTISSVDINESFYKIREDLKKLAYGSYILELCEFVIVEGITNNRLFDTLLKTLYLITYKNIDYDLVTLTFQIKLLNYIGYRPELEKCVGCGRTEFEKKIFNIEQGGLVCDDCKDLYNKSYQVNDTMLKFLEYILIKDIITVSKLKIRPSILQRAKKLIENYLEIHLERKVFKSLEFLKSINNNYI